MDDQTLVQVVRLSAGGPAIRIRFTNEDGKEPLLIGAARVSLLGKGGPAASDTVVTFSGLGT